MEKYGNVSVCSAATGLNFSCELKCDQMVDNDHVVQFFLFVCFQILYIEQQRQTLTILCLKTFMSILVFLVKF